VKRIAHESASARFLAFGVPDPTPWHYALLVMGGAALLVPLAPSGAARRLGRSLVMASLTVSLGVVEWFARAAGQSQGLLRVTALDVGQGDANLVELPDGSAWLFDAGGMVGNPIDTGAAVVVPVLRAKRRTRLDVVVLTHPHPDHFGGLLAVLKAVEVGEIWDSGQGEAEGAGPAYAALLAYARERRIPVRRPRELCGRPRLRGGASLELLAPCPGFVPGRGANDNSLVVHATFGRRAALLTGDAEALEERDLLARAGSALRADYLKAGHHGSRTSPREALLRAVEPRWATLSCGVRNRFGHPHAAAVERLAREGAHVVRLDRSGSFEWTTDGADVVVRLALLPR
jgi:competence protein ComEC